MNEIPERTRLLRNLRDAGCDKAIIQKYFQLKEEGRRKKAGAVSFIIHAQGIIIG